MKQIQNFDAPKYSTNAYTRLEEGIYEYSAPDGITSCVTSLMFVQEPEYGEGSSAAELSQYPLEDLLNEYWCLVSDFYEDLNQEDAQVCHLEFTGEAEDLRNLRTIIGKHVYTQQDGDSTTLVVE